MDFLKDNIKTIYFKYLAASFGSTLITSIYGIVDMAMVGQYHGPDGTSALAVVAPLWNIIYSLGLLMGIGGSVLFSTARGAVISGAMLFILPICAGADAIWFSMPLTELITAIYASVNIWICTRALRCAES